MLKLKISKIPQRTFDKNKIPTTQIDGVPSHIPVQRHGISPCISKFQMRSSSPHPEY